MPKAMRQMCRAIGTTVVLVTLSVTAVAAPALAQTQDSVGSERKRITGAQLEDALRQTRRGEPLSGVIVSGKELQAIIQAGELDIRVDDALVEGGLAFEPHSTVAGVLEITNSEITAEAVSRRLSAGTSLHARRTTFQGPVDFSGTTFLGPVDFGQASFAEPARFSRATFRGPARFDKAAFLKSAEFQRLTAEKNLRFEGTTFEDRAAFSKAQLAEVTFSQAQFLKSANFGETRFSDQASFWRTQFEGRARFDGASFAKSQVFDSDFRGPPTFANTSFGENLEFRGAETGDRRQFASGVRFLETTVNGYAVFNHLDVGGDLMFLGVTIKGGLQLAYSNIGGFFSLSESLIGGPSNFDGSHFQAAASFARTDFDSETTFGATRFAKSAVFQETCFAGRLALQSSDLGPYADFRGAEIGHLDLSNSLEPTIYRSRIDLRRASITRADFEDVIFTGSVDASDATFGETATLCGFMEEPLPIEPGLDLRFVTFEDTVSAQRTNFQKRLSMSGAKFEQGVDFTNATFPKLRKGGKARFALSFVDFGDLRLRWHQLPDPRYWSPVQNVTGIAANTKAARSKASEPVSHVLAGLERMFRDRGQLADANNATYHRKRSELAEARRAGWTADRLEKELEWLVWGLTCGYGTKIWWIVGWALLLNLCFTLIYWRWATLERAPHPDVEKDFSFRLRLLDLPQHYREKVGALPGAAASQRKLINALRISSVILFKIGYRDTTVSGRIGRIGINSIVRLEWFLGFLILAAFTVTLSNTQPLINRLISGVL